MEVVPQRLGRRGRNRKVLARPSEAFNKFSAAPFRHAAPTGLRVRWLRILKPGGHMWNCPHSREKVEDNFDVCRHCQTGKGGSVPETYFTSAKPKVNDRGSAKDSPQVKVRDSSEAACLMKRYTDGHLGARAISGFGSLIKLLAVVLAILRAIIGFLVAARDGPREPVSYLGILGICAGIISGVLFYVIGGPLSAEGQILKAFPDGAINGSPFLTNEQRKKIMSL